MQLREILNPLIHNARFPPPIAVQALRGSPSSLKADRQLWAGKAPSPQAPNCGHWHSKLSWHYALPHPPLMHETTVGNLTATAERKLRLAQRYEVAARWLGYSGIAIVVLAGLMGSFSTALVGVCLAMPATWVFNLRCPACGWLIYRVFGTAKRHGHDQMLAPLYSKQLWHQPPACTKCALHFHTDRGS